METTITVRRAAEPTASLDLRVAWAVPVTVGEVAAAIATTLGMPRAHLLMGGRAIPTSLAWGQPPMLHGATVVVAPGAPALADSENAAPPGRGPLFDLVVASGPDCGQRVALTAGTLVIGRSGAADLPLGDEALSRRHARVSATAEGVTVEDLGSTNGVLVNGLPAPDGEAITRRSRVRVGSSSLCLRRPEVVRALDPDGRGGLVARPEPRPVTETEPRVFTPPRAPEVPAPARLPWLTMVLPLPIAAVLAAVFGPQFLLFALLGPVTVGATWLGDRRSRRQRWSLARSTHAEALARHEAGLAAALELEAEQLHERWPDPVSTLDTAVAHGCRLWERTAASTDFLRLRLGTGAAPARGIRLGDDRTEEPAPRHSDAPVPLDLRAARRVTVRGPSGRRSAVLRQLVGQVAVWHPPSAVALVVVTDATLLAAWEWARWLPHTGEHPVVSAIGNGERLRGVLAAHRTDGRHTVVVVPDVDGLDDATREVLLDTDHEGRTLVVAGADAGRDHTGWVVTLDPDGDHLEGDGSVERLVCDGVGPWWSERLARALAPVREAGAAHGTGTVGPWAGLEPPDGDGAADVADQVLARWEARAERQGRDAAYAVVGTTDGRPWTVDLDRDGPHLLIGGTTGAGKSELLRSLLVGLAVGSSPATLTFLLVDYKGGSTFPALRDLPHTVGVVDDLDPRLAERALRSLRAEVKRREERLAAVGASSRADFLARGPDEPLPRLVVVVDEFRVLAQEHPAVLDELVRLAAVGRSLGIHLILATQRPAGAITPDIQANVDLRIALRMRDAADSVQVIGSADAASIPPSAPGTGLARTADGMLTRFTTFHITGAVPRTDEGLRVEVVAGLPPAPHCPPPAAESGPTVEEALVAGIRAAWQRFGHAAPRRPWRPPLPRSVDAADLTSGDPGRVPIGRSDHPDEQDQRDVVWGLADGPVRFVGGPGSGRSTALRTVLTQLARVATPQDVVAYAVTARPSLADVADLPLVGAVVRVDEAGRVRRLLDLLDDLVSAAERGDGPRVVLAIDDWDLVLTQDSPWTARLERLVRRLGSGGGHGTVVAAGGRALGSSRVVAGGLMVLLSGLEPADLLLHGVRPGAFGQECPPGRGVRVDDRAEVQLALPAASPVPVTSRRRPPAVVDLPTRIRLADLDPAPDLEPLLAVGDGPQECRWGAGQWGPTLLIAGTAGSGRSNALRALGEEWTRRGRTVATLGLTPDLPRPAHTLTPTDLLDELSPLVRSGREVLVLVDDADSLPAATEQALLDVTTRAGTTAVRLAVAVRKTTLTQAFRGLVPALAARGTGLLLGELNRHDGDPFGVRLDPPTAAGPGRGVLVVRGKPREVQVLLAG